MVDKINLKKTHTREHSILYGSIWNDSDYLHIEELWGNNIKNFLILKEKGTNRLSGWYDFNELDNIYNWVVNQMKDNPNFFQLAKKRFFQHLDKMLPYLKKKEKIETFQELKEYYHNWLNWWSPMDTFFVMPDFDIPAEMKKEALIIRKETEKYTGILDEPFLEFFYSKFPEYKNIAMLINKKELFELEKRRFTEEEIQEIKKREDGCAIFRNKIILINNLNAELEKHSLYLEEKIHAPTKELIGMCACPGKVRGRVQLMLKKEDFHKFVPGSIIVTEMTSPEFVSIIERAAGIITDEGGVTCHAAIVSREFGVPCIVGTEKATHVLKEGDIVELNNKEGAVNLVD